MDELRERALELAKDRASTPSNLSRVSAATSVEAARWAFGQWEARKKATSKFDRAETMLFDRESLEMATTAHIAEYHASRFPQGSLVADLTTGIGADLLALARRGPAVGYELNPDRAEYALHNLGVHDLTAEIRVQDSLSSEWDFGYAFADPARRIEGRRTSALSEFSPDPVTLAERLSHLKLGGMKLSPMLQDSDLESLGPCLEFVSFGGECREALVWMGEEAESGRLAVHIESGERLPAGEKLYYSTDKISDYLLEVDPAAIRAHCLSNLADQFKSDAVGDTNGYLTGNDPVDSPWVKTYKVLHTCRADPSTARAFLRSIEAAKPILKQRGTGQDLQKLAKEFPAYGTRPVAIALWAVGKSLRYTIVEA